MTELRWYQMAACGDADPTIFSPHGGGGDIYRKARKECSGCAVQLQCLEDALKYEPPYGAFRAGLTPEQQTDLWSRAAA